MEISGLNLRSCLGERCTLYLLLPSASGRAVLLAVGVHADLGEDGIFQWSI